MQLSLSELYISYLNLFRFILSVALHVNFLGMVFMAGGKLYPSGFSYCITHTDSTIILF